jgi:cell division protein FtsW (lipid II flippase)
VELRWSHWAGFVAWLILTIIANRMTARQLPERDPFLFPSASLLSGWGLLAIWRLDPAFGARQAVWLSVSIIAFVFLLRVPQAILLLRRYKYALLTGGLFLTALTLLFGTNPAGNGPRLWLGCCGVYFQPSEPLKLLFVIYLAAYLSDRLQFRVNIFPLLLPTLIVTGLALILLLVQRDLGTVSIFLVLFTVALFLATGRRRILLAAAAGLGLSLLVGFLFIDTIQIRVNAWLDPWLDPAGRSYQIVQSLLAIANGGAFGRGPGLGSPGLVPVAISDFIFSAIVEETGLIGTIGLLTLFWILLARGLISSLRAPDRFRRMLAAGIVTYLGVQSLLIIGGNLRLLPLTGVTLPFVSYGGSSLLTSYIALWILIAISGQNENEPAPLPTPRPYIFLTGLLGLSLAAAGLTAAWWTIIRGPDLLTRTDNARRAIADRYVPRGDLLDRNNQPIHTTEGESGSYARVYIYPELGPVTGYTHPVYGQAGLEASLDDYLRGLKGNPASLVWWDHLLYGTPPPGLDVRLSIDLKLQSKADELLGENSGALVLLNAQTGEILAMASHPTFDPNQLDEEGSRLAHDPAAPLLNRAALGQYPLGNTLLPLIRAQFGNEPPGNSALAAFYERLGLYRTPDLNMPLAAATNTGDPDELRVNPLQVALAAAVLSNDGIIPAPRIAMAVNTPEQGWVVLPALGQPLQAIQAGAANEAALAFVAENKTYWQNLEQTGSGKNKVTWLIAGTLPNWQGTPLALVITLESDNPALINRLCERYMTEALNQ